MWPVQAVALDELAHNRGLFVVVAVGGGKTLICYLAPVMVQASRPLHLIPASLRDKTRREFAEYSRHFYGFKPEAYRIESYQRLASIGQSDLLESYKPDVIVCDEAQHLENPRAAATRRLKRYVEGNPGIRCVFLSGTITKRSIKDYSHLAAWALKELSPVPRTWTDVEPWAQAIDEKPAQGRRILPGGLRRLAGTPSEVVSMNSPSVDERIATCRAVYRRRFETTPGVVTSDKSTLPVGLIIRDLDPEEFPLDPHDGMEKHWLRFREDWELPDGEPMVDVLEISRHARELSLGFFYRWKFPAPEPWKEARRQWGRFIRKTLKHSRTLDTELQVIRAIRSGHCHNQDEGEAVLFQWEAVKPTFVPITEPQWLSDTVLRHCARWMSQHPGIVWVEQECFGSSLSRATGVPFYGEQGRAVDGRRIEDHKPQTPLIASMRANGTGRNLQGWHYNLITAPPYTGASIEQLIGRTHRNGQEKEAVFFDMLTNCSEHVRTFWKTVKDSEYIQSTTGIPQRLGMATLDVRDSDDIDGETSARWW